MGLEAVHRCRSEGLPVDRTGSRRDIQEGPENLRIAIERAINHLTRLDACRKRSRRYSKAVQKWVHGERLELLQRTWSLLALPRQKTGPLSVFLSRTADTACEDKQANGVVPGYARSFQAVLNNHIEKRILENEFFERFYYAHVLSEITPGIEEDTHGIEEDTTPQFSINLQTMIELYLYTRIPERPSEPEKAPAPVIKKAVVVHRPKPPVRQAAQPKKTAAEKEGFQLICPTDAERYGFALL